MWWKRLVLAVAIGLAAGQFIRPAKTNPPSDARLEMKAAESLSPHVAGVLARACDDCHSHRTHWPWYSNISPASWLVTHDVNEGRSEMNLSQWGIYSQEKRLELLRKICTQMSEGEMPPLAYRVAHPAARLKQVDVKTVCAWTRL